MLINTYYYSLHVDIFNVQYEKQTVVAYIYTFYEEGIYSVFT